MPSYSPAQHRQDCDRALAPFCQHPDLPFADVLTGADLEHARMHHTTLRGADLRGANLEGVQLRGLDLTDTRIDLAQAALFAAAYGARVEP